MKFSIPHLMLLPALLFVFENCGLVSPRNTEYISSFGPGGLRDGLDSWKNISVTLRETSTNPNLTGNHDLRISAGYRNEQLPFPLWEADFQVDTVRIESIGPDFRTARGQVSMTSSIDVFEEEGRIRISITERPSGCFIFDPSYIGLRAVPDTFRSFNPGSTMRVDSIQVRFPHCELNQQNRVTASQFVDRTQKPLTDDGVRMLMNNEHGWYGTLNFGKVHVPSEVDSIRMSFTIKIINHFDFSVVDSMFVDFTTKRRLSEFTGD